VDVEAIWQLEHLPQGGDPGSDGHDDLLDVNGSGARMHALDRARVVAIEAEDLDAVDDRRAGGSCLRREAVHRLLVEGEAAGVLVQADRQPVRAPVGVQAAHMTEDGLLADVQLEG
jgi:hypothetical protein